MFCSSFLDFLGEVSTQTNTSLIAKVRASFTSETNKGANAHIWVRDIENWSKAFHANRGCIRDDGVHVSCILFNELYVGLFMNYVAGNLELNKDNPLVLNVV
jgi:hypothetical protein